MKLHRLDMGQADALLRFELENREWFAHSVPDRGDDYFASFTARLTALLEEQEAGVCHFHVLVDQGEIIGRFNLVDVADGAAELGFRVAERVAGRGVATTGVSSICTLARQDYGLTRLTAEAARNNPGSLGVLRRAGFRPIGEVTLAGLPGIRHLKDLTSDQPTPVACPPRAIGGPPAKDS